MHRALLPRPTIRPVDAGLGGVYPAYDSRESVDGVDTARRVKPVCAHDYQTLL